MAEDRRAPARSATGADRDQPREVPADVAERILDAVAAFEAERDAARLAAVIRDGLLAPGTTIDGLSRQQQVDYLGHHWLEEDEDE